MPWTTNPVPVAAPLRPEPEPEPRPLAAPEPLAVPETEFRVVFVQAAHDDPDQARLAQALACPEVLSYLARRCGPAGWRVWTPDVDVSGESEVWRELWPRVAPALLDPPRLVIFRGPTAVVLPIPETPYGTYELLRNYGGE